MNTEHNILKLIDSCEISSELKTIARKVWDNERINEFEAITLYEEGELGYLSALASHRRKEINSNYTYFNRNFHIEPSNICIYNCKFCSYARKINQEGVWEYSEDEIAEKVKPYQNTKVTEVHIVGGVHPKKDLHFYGKIFQKIKQIIPTIHIKAFTAVEIAFMANKAGLSFKEALALLHKYGLDSLPGGGAEIFDSEIREKICPEKASAQTWLEVHQAAHELEIPSNATILYGHIEEYRHRVHHMKMLRNLQDITGGFNTFIPLKYRQANNPMSEIGEVSITEDLKNFAVSRIYLDNFPHLKAYWPGIGKAAAQSALEFGVDDLDGTIDDSTKIYSLAGAEEQNPKMTTEELTKLIKESGRIPAERDTLYNIIKTY